MTIEGPLSRDLVSYDPLTEVTRNERRSLLGISMLGVAMARVPLVPEKFAAFDIQFDSINQRTFVALYGLLVVYYLVAFVIYAMTDYIAWRRSRVIAYQAYVRQAETEPHRSPDEPGVPAEPWELPAGHFRENLMFTGWASYWLARRAAALRATLEFVLPVVFGAYSMWTLGTYYFSAT